MIIIFTIFLATVVTNSRGKHIELLSNEEFQDKLSRRSEGGDDSNEDNNSKQIISEESHIDIGNRDDKSYKADVDLAGINRRSYRGEHSADSANFNEATLSVTNDNKNKSTKEGEKVKQEKNTPDYRTTIGVIDTKQSETDFVITKNTTGESTTLTKTGVVLSIYKKHSSNKSTAGTESQAPNYDSKIQVPENDSTVNNSESSSKAAESFKHDSSNVILTGGSTIDSLIDTTTNSSANVFTTLNRPIFSTATQNTDEVNTATIKGYSAVTENISTNEHLENNIKTTTFIPALTPAIENEQSTKKPKKITNTVISTVNEIENVTKSEQCLYCYRVYEILYPTKRGNQQFLRNQETIKHQPYFVPVYKYAPNFANFNPSNRLGINKVKEKSKELGASQRHERNINVHDTAKASDILTNFYNDLRKFKMFKNKTKRPNTLDELTRKGSKRTHDTKTKVKKNARTFDETQIDLIPELMYAKLGKAYTYKNLVDMKHAIIEQLFDFAKLREVIANSKMAPNKTNKKRSNDESNINIQMNVLKDLILEDNKSLKQYDWLATTVQIQSALLKILKLINRMRQSELIHPADLQILKYIVFLHNFSLRIKEENKLDNKWEKRAKLLPRNKKKRKNKLLKEKGLFNRVWLLRMLLPDLIKEDEFSHLYKFIMKVQDGLFDLHEAIRHIAEVTKFDRQNWYDNLKQLYLSADKKHLRELLLHISMSRLVDLVEHSCKPELDHDFIIFLETHEKVVRRIVEEMVFIDKIVVEFEIKNEVV